MSGSETFTQPAFLEAENTTTFEVARTVVLPVPYEGTVSYGGGTARGPAAILAASQQVEFHDEQHGDEPRRHGIWTCAPLDLAGASPGEVVGQVRRRWAELLDAGKWVLMLGGEHSITPGAVAAAAECHADLCVVQLDAHADLRDQLEGERHSHACAMARCLEHAEVRGIGIRSFSPEEAARLRRGQPGYRMLPAWELDRPGAIDAVLAGLEGRAVYLTVDVDYFDPSIIPGTGTPEPGGGRWWPTLQLLERLFGTSRVVGADLVELAPIAGQHHSEFTAARLAYKLLGLASRSFRD